LCQEKDKEGITLKISYNDRNLLYVLAKQAYHGYYKEDVQKQIGFLDLVGKDRAYVLPSSILTFTQCWEFKVFAGA
jgi:hypothetical protein